MWTLQNSSDWSLWNLIIINFFTNPTFFNKDMSLSDTTHRTRKKLLREFDSRADKIVLESVPYNVWDNLNSHLWPYEANIRYHYKCNGHLLPSEEA